MEKNMTKKMTTVFFTFVFLLTITTVAFGQCEKNADSQIVAEIYSNIKADKGLAAQITHINVISTSGAVKLQGWANDESSFDKVSDIALNTACVRLVNDQAFLKTPPPTGDSLRSGPAGCASGTKPCGDICIPEGDACNLGGSKGAAVFRFNKNFFLEMAAPDNSCG